MRHASHTRGSVTEAASCTPTDWATLGARILAAARQAVSIHMAQAAQSRAQDPWALDDSGVDLVAKESDSAEPNE
jgi:hypothetical protein